METEKQAETFKNIGRLEALLDVVRFIRKHNGDSIGYKQAQIDILKYVVSKSDEITTEAEAVIGVTDA